MEKNIKGKFSKIFLFVSVMCLAVLFSTVIFTGVKKDVLAENWNQEVNTGYIFEDDEECSSATYNSSFDTVDAPEQSCYSLRDDYVMFTQNQDRNGLCWAYASSMAITSTIMTATGQYYDFSEAWISLAGVKEDSSYIFGDGGNAKTYNDLVNKYGLVLESDFQYQNSYYINSENYNTFYTYYSQYANKNIMENLTYVSYKLSTQQNAIKNHILNNGALSISMSWDVDAENAKNGVVSNSSYVYKVPNTNVSAGHAITLIGWDDNFSTKVNNKTHTGAWVCLNSWGDSSGDDNVLYVFYDDADLKTNVYGYIYSEGGNYTNSIDETSGYTYTTNLKGKYYSSTNYTASENETQQKNIYYCDDVDITYDYSTKNGAIVNSIEIYYGTEDVTNNFNVNIDRNNSLINVKAQNLSTGPYKIIVNYSNNGVASEYINVIYVLDGTEVGFIQISHSSSSTIKNIGLFYGYNTYNYANLEYTIPTNVASGYVNFYTWWTAYSDNEVYSSTQTIRYSGLSKTENSKTYTTKIEHNEKEKIITVNIIYVDGDYKFANFFYSLDGGKSTSFDRVVVDNNGAELKIPTRKGYTFAGWYYDCDLNDNLTYNKDTNTYLYDQSRVTTIENTKAYPSSDGTYWAPIMYANLYYNTYLDGSSFAIVYAKWTLNTSATAKLVLDSKIQNVGTQFEISYEVEHELKNVLVLQSVEWYKDGNLIPEATASVLQQTLTEQGVAEYSAVINFTLYGTTLRVETDKVKVVALNNIQFKPEKIDGSGVFTWSAVEGATSYTLKIYIKQDETFILIKTKTIIVSNTETLSTASLFTSTNSNLTYDLINELNENEDGENYVAGIYKIGIVANVTVAGTEYASGEQLSDEINVYKVSFVTYSTNIPDVFVNEGKQLASSDIPTPSEKSGYQFKFWCLDAERTQEFNTLGITQNATLYANWEMDDIQNIDNIDGITKKYDGTNSSITVNPIHASGLTNFTYEWFYIKDSIESKLDTTQNTVAVKDAKDSGTYYCKVSLVDENGFKVNNKTNNIVVLITRNTTIINVANVKTDYTYTGSEQTVSTGAFAESESGVKISNMEITYLIKELASNKFIDVPENGEYTLLITALGTDNYDSTETEVKLTINKATSILKANKSFETFTYRGEEIGANDIEHYLGNTEQSVVIEGTKPKNAGTYSTVKLVALESKNYNRIEIETCVIINPANIIIEVNDVVGFLFAKVQPLTWSIKSGEIFGNDDLNITLSADVDTSKIGRYDISIEYENANYRIAVSEGKYMVTALPYYVGIVILMFVIYFIIRELNKRHYQYDFETNGGEVVKPIDTKNKESIVLETPVKKGYRFVGWYTDMELTKPFKKRFRKSKGKVLYAKWEKVDKKVANLSEELKNAQKIVDEIQSIINPHKEEVKEVEVKPVEQEQPKEKTEKEKMDDLIGSIDTNLNDVSEQDLKNIIKNIIEKND